MIVITKKLLHVGCGSKGKAQTTAEFNREHWVETRYDIDPQSSPDIVGSITDMSMIKNANYDGVFSSHNIEHLFPHEVPAALSEFYRVTKEEGFVVLTCPDLQSVAQLIADDKLTEPAYDSPAGAITPLDILYGHRASIQRGQIYMAHKCGFTQKVLIDTFKRAGFRKIASLRREKPFFDLWVAASKREVTDAEIRSLAESHFPKGT